MFNREVFVNDPLKTVIPNDGVAKVLEPSSPQEWGVLRYELRTFVCKGEYEKGLDRILSTFLQNLGEPTQPAVWISGFYGSGKSHLARMLEFLWRNVRFPDGVTARGLATLPGTIGEYLKELSTIGKQEGGLWSAAGTLGAGAGDSVRLAFLGMIFKSAGLPSQYAPARFSIWMQREGCYDAVRRGVEAAGRDFEAELRDMYVSPVLAKSLIAATPGFAANETEARQQLRAQFPPASDVSDDDVIASLGDVLAIQSTRPGKLPCALIVLDELQQYIGTDSNRTLAVQNLVETCCSRFQSRILFVATGQSALQATPQLSKLQGRFTVQVALSDADVEKVIREVALRKAPDKRDAVREAMDACSGEIDRELSGAKIGPTPADRHDWVADYPLLPARRRFWERVLRAVDQAGAAGQLRSQLRIVHEANRQVAEEPLGTVIGGDFIFERLVPAMKQSGVLLQELELIIKRQNDGSPDGYLRERLCAAIFLISQLPTEPGTATGVRTTAETLADLLVQNLKSDGVPLRQRIPGLLNDLVVKGDLMQLEDEYRLQTRESAAWDMDYRGRFARLFADDAKIASDRLQTLRSACDKALKGIVSTQGVSKVPRKIELHFTADAPGCDTGGIPVWIRDEWSVAEKTVREDAQAAGTEGPIIYVFLPQTGTAQAFKTALAMLAAATETLQERPIPSTHEGVDAQCGMQTRRDDAQKQVDNLVSHVLAQVRVFQGGGSEVSGDDLKSVAPLAAQASLARLYPHFGRGDHAHWSNVVKRAQQGSGDALEAVDYKGEVENHPVCSTILTALGSGGKKGADIRKQFMGPPYGWAQDTVDGALLALLAGSRLRAAQDGAAVAAKGLKQTDIGKVEFRVEGVTITTPIRIAVRGLLQDAGVACKPNEESQSAPAYLQEMITLAHGAGGDPPLPERPSINHIQEIKSFIGNQQLMALFEQKARLVSEFKEWRKLKQAAESRRPHWDELLRLLKHAETLPVYQQVAPQVEAIREHRSLLSDPDPVPPLSDRLAESLRTEAQHARKKYVELQTSLLPDLIGSATWKNLPPADQSVIRSQFGLGPEPELRVGTTAELLLALDARSLAGWEERIAALPQRISQARLAAEKRTQPDTVHVPLPHRTLRTVADVDEYVKDIRELLVKEVESGKAVLI